jgi:hypothetical protein
MNGARRWQNRLDITNDEGFNRQQLRDRARATRQKGAPRGRPRDLLTFTLIGMRNLQAHQFALAA